MNDPHPFNVCRTRLRRHAHGLIVTAVVAAAVIIPMQVVLAQNSTAPLAVRVSGNHLVDGSGNAITLRGVDLSGTEYACVQGGTPTSRGWSLSGGAPIDQASTFAAMTSWHANVVRVPLNEDCWLGINGVNPAYSGATYRAAIQTEVNLIHQAGMYAVLDLHWSAPGAYSAYWQQPMADADHSVTFWQSVATTYKSDPAVIFDLYNEPFFYYIASNGPDQWSCWLNGCTMTQFISNGQVTPSGQTTPYATTYTWNTAGVQTLIDTVRATGATQPILANGVDWANDLSGWMTHKPNDPAGQLIAGWHSYPGQPCAVQSCWTGVIQPITKTVPVLVGETGDSSAGAPAYINTFLPWADSVGISYLAWTWNPWGDANDVAIKDWSGTPTTGEGQYYHDHLLAVAGAPAPSPTPTPPPAPPPPPPASGSVALRATATAPSSYGTGSSGSLTVPATVRAGDVMLAQVNNNGPSGQTMTPPAGWALVPTSANPTSPTATSSTWWYFKVATGSDPGSMATWTWSGGSLYWSAVLADYAGVNTTTPFDGAVIAGGSSKSPATGGLTTKVSGDQLTAWAVGVTGPTLVSGGLTQQAIESVQQNAGEWDAGQGAPGATGAYGWSLSASHSWATAVIALQPATPSTAPPPPPPPTPPPSPPPASAASVGINVEPSYRPWRWAGGPNPDSWWDPATGVAKVDAEMPLIAQAHATSVRVEFPWTYLEPTNGTYDWSRADYIVNSAKQHGVQVQPILVFCPPWEGAPNCVPNATDFQAFVTAMASRYKGTIGTWEFGNEPDLSRYFSGTEAQWIATMQNPGYAAVKAVDPTNVVVSAGMAVPGNLSWIDGLKANGAKFDVQAYHDYPGSAAQVNVDGWAVRNQLNADGFASSPLWLDEFGVQENSTSDTNQQAWLTTVLSPGANPATNIKWYNLRDDNIYTGATTVDHSEYWGLFRRDLTAKQGLATFQLLASPAAPPPPVPTPPPPPPPVPPVTLTGTPCTITVGGKTTAGNCTGTFVAGP